VAGGKIMARKKRFGPDELYPSEFGKGILKWYIVGEECWYMVGANRWYMVGEDDWYMFDANIWYIMPEDYWYIVIRGVTGGHDH
jgi:hypothetical protein